MRTSHELFEVLLEEYKKGDMIFICNTIDRIYNKNIISYEEKLLLRKAFEKERPTTKKNKEFYEREKFGIGGGWFAISEGRVCTTRVKFLEMLVEKTKPKGK